jgi:hypothetical protein
MFYQDFPVSFNLVSLFERNASVLIFKAGFARNPKRIQNSAAYCGGRSFINKKLLQI